MAAARALHRVVALVPGPSGSLDVDVQLLGSSYLPFVAEFVQHRGAGTCLWERSEKYNSGSQAQREKIECAGSMHTCMQICVNVAGDTGPGKKVFYDQALFTAHVIDTFDRLVEYLNPHEDFDGVIGRFGLLNNLRRRPQLRRFRSRCWMQENIC